jgi:hypothetical protein
VSSFRQLHLKGGGGDSEHEESSRPVISDADSPNQHSDDTNTVKMMRIPRRDPSGGTTPLEMFK